jgi:hypothetical protein
MRSTADHLVQTIKQALPFLNDLTEETASLKDRPGKWSKKEILGHLIDSANNNQQKFVRTIAETGVHFPPYDQDIWVSAQHYDQADWKQLISLWDYSNRHLAHLIKHIPATALHHTIHIGNEGPYTLEFIANDYVEHLKHHLNQIAPKLAFTSTYPKP